MDYGRISLLCCIIIVGIYLSFREKPQECYLTKGDVVYKIGTRSIGKVISVDDKCNVLVEYDNGRRSLKPESPYNFKLLE